jgi:hypothetical protein
MKDKFLVITCIFVSLCLAYQAAAEDVNIALGKPATVSTLWDPQNLASYAVDGIYPQAYPYLVHTAAEDYDPWWKVDLESQYEIKVVELWNRQECCQDRLRNIIIEVLDKDGTTVNYGSEIINPDNVLESPMSITYTLDTPTVGRYVQVRRIPDEVIGDESTYILCVSEVLVYGITAWNPVPDNGQMYVAPDASFSWSVPISLPYTPTSYDLTYGENPSLTTGGTVITDLTETTYDPPENFDFFTTYYWRLDAYDGETKYEGDIWSFTTDGKADNPDPADGAVRVGQDASLNWRAVNVDGVTYNVYYVQSTDPNTIEFVDNFSTNSFTPPVRDPDALCYWKVDSVCDANIIESDLWSFTTGGIVVDPYPADSNSILTATEITLSWTGDREGDTYIDAYDVYFSTDPVVEVTTTSYQIPYELADGTTYAWRVDTKHEGAVVTTGDTWKFITGQLAGHWPFDNNLNDIVGDNDGDRSGSPAFTDGFIGEAVDFEDDLAQKPVSIPLNAVGSAASWALRLWEYSYADGVGWETILGNGDGSQGGWETFEFGRYNSNRYILGFNSGLANEDYRATPDDSSYLREGWHFHVISYDSVTKTVHWYINGSLVTTFTGIDLLPLDPELYVGNVSGKSQPFNGKVDELKLYSRPLSAAQVLEAYTTDSGFPFDPIPATGAEDIPWDVTLQWSFAETPIGVSIEVGKLQDLSDATPVTLTPDATSFNVVTGLGVKLTPSTGYFWRLTAEYPTRTAVGPTWFFAVRDLLGDVSGNLVVEISDVTQMADKWLEDTSDYPPEVWNYMDQENWGDDPNVLDYFVPWPGDGSVWAVGHIELQTDPTDSNNFTPGSQTVIWSYDTSEGGNEVGITITLLERIDFSKWDKFGYWVYQRNCISTADIRIDSANGDGIYRDWYDMSNYNGKWHKYEWDVPAGAATDVYQIRFYRGSIGDNTSEEFSYFYLSKDDTTVKICLPWNLTNIEDLTLDCKINLNDLALMAQDWLLDASN